MDKSGFDSTTVKILTRAVNTICIFIIFICFLIITLSRSSLAFDDLVNHSSILQSLWIIIPMVFTALVLLFMLFLLLLNFRRQRYLKAQQNKDILNMPLEHYGADTGAKAEIPVQNYNNVSEGFMEVNNGANIAAAQEAHIKRQIDMNTAETAKYEGLARQALQAGKEDDARIFIGMKQNLEAARKVLDTAYANVINMRRMHDNMMNGMQDVQTRHMVNVQTTVARNGKIVSQTSYTNMPQGAPDVFSGMGSEAEKLFAKANAMLDAMGTQTMGPSLFERQTAWSNAVPSGAGINTQLKDEAEALAGKYAANGSAAPAEEETDAAQRTASVDDELAKMKKDMGL